MIKKLSFIIAIATVALTLTLCASAAPASAPGGEVTSYEGLVTALGGEDNVSLVKNGDGEVDHLIVYNDILLSAPVRITSGEYVIYGAGATFTCSFKEGSFFEISGDKTSLTVGNTAGSKSEDTFFDGKNESRNGSFFKVGEGAALAVYPGTVMKDTVTTVSGGAIFNEGSLVIYGGKYTGCRAVVSGGVIYNEGEVVLTSGSISSCSSGLGGGLYNGGKATLVGMTISECIADKGGAIYNASEMKFASAAVTSSKAKEGAGLYNEGECEFLGGSIKECLAENGTGGAVHNNGKLILTAGTFDENKALEGGNVYNAKEMTIDTNMSLFSGKAETGGNIYNSGDALFKGGAVSLGKATYGAGVFNLGKLDLQGCNIHSNKATVGGGILNHGSVVMTKNGYIDPSNDFFTVLDEDNSHALVIGEGWVYDRQIIKLSCGIAVDDGYEYKESVGDVLILTEYEYDINDRFALFNKNGLALSKDGTLVKAAPDLSVLLYVLGGIAAFAAVVTAIVLPVRYFDKKKAPTVSADDYF